VIQADEMTWAQWATVAFEIAIHAAGLALFLWLVFSRRARAMPKSLLPEWNIPAVDFGIFLCSGLMGAAVANAVAGSILHWVHPTIDASVVAASAAMEGGFLLGMLCFHAVYRRAGRDAPAATRIGAGLRGGFLTFLVAMPFVTGINLCWGQFLTRMGLPDEKQELVSILENTHSVVLQGLFVLVATLLVPAAEEVLFRGGLFRYLRTRIPRWAAVASTSVVFGALHVQWSDHMGGLPSLLPLIVWK